MNGLMQTDNVKLKHVIKKYHCNLDIVFEDFVVVCRPVTDRKIVPFLWAGPRRVIDVSGPPVYVVKNPFMPKEETTHVTLIQKCNEQMDKLHLQRKC